MPKTKTKTKKLKNEKKWQCPMCKSEITVFVNLVYPPTCKNKDFHSTKSVDMLIVE